MPDDAGRVLGQGAGNHHWDLAAYAFTAADRAPHASRPVEGADHIDDLIAPVTKIGGERGITAPHDTLDESTTTTVGLGGRCADADAAPSIGMISRTARMDDTPRGDHEDDVST